MKKILYPFLCLIFLTNNTYCQGIAPSISKEWTSHAYVELSNYLDDLSSSEYPTLSSKGDLFHKTINSISQPILQNQDLSLDLRMQQAINLHTAVNQILMKYNNAYVAGIDYSTELSYLLGLSLSVSTQVISVVEEFIQTLDPSNEKYEAQLEGLKMMRNGTATQLDGALISLAETHAFSNEERKIMATYIAANAYEILSFLEEGYKTEFTLKLERHIMFENEGQIKEKLKPLLNKLRM